MCGGVPPPGATESSDRKRAPPVSSPVRRKVISSPGPQYAVPVPAGTRLACRSVEVWCGTADTISSDRESMACRVILFSVQVNCVYRGAYSKHRLRKMSMSSFEENSAPVTAEEMLI